MPQLFKTVNYAIHQMVAQLVSLILTSWTGIYPADSAIHRFNNQVQCINWSYTKNLWPQQLLQIYEPLNVPLAEGVSLK